MVKMIIKSSVGFEDTWIDKVVRCTRHCWGNRVFLIINKVRPGPGSPPFKSLDLAYFPNANL